MNGGRSRWLTMGEWQWLVVLGVGEKGERKGRFSRAAPFIGRGGGVEHVAIVPHVSVGGRRLAGPRGDALRAGIAHMGRTVQPGRPSPQNSFSNIPNCSKFVKYNIPSLLV
jgi:hypothetical protein